MTLRSIAFVQLSSRMSGVEFSTLYLVQHLDRKRWEPLVICPEEGDLPERCRESKVPVAIVPRSRFYSTSLRVAGVAIPNPFALIADVMALAASARALARFLRTEHPTLVVPKGLLAQFYGGLAARWAGIPCVWHVQDRVSSRAGPLFAWTLAVAGRVLARQIIVDADTIAQQLQTFVAPERISVVWNGVDTCEFTPEIDGSRVRAEWHAAPNDLLIGVVGRLTPWKGQHLAIGAFARVARQFPAARLVLVGSALFDTDAYARKLKADTTRRDLADRVIFAGFRRDMPQVLAALDVVAHTALDKDSSPLAVVSAMASGKPIICSRVDGTAQLFEDGVDGLLVPPGDVNALAGELARLLSDPALRAHLGQAAREKAERALSVEQFVRRCGEVFERALG